MLGCPNDNYDLIEWEDQQTEALEGLWESEKKPNELADGRSRVIPWATTDNGECLYWLVRSDQSPDEWTVMVNEARGDRWELQATWARRRARPWWTSGRASPRAPVAQ